MDLTKHYSTTNTPQTEPIPGRTDMVQNDAGGYGWEVNKWQQLERFLGALDPDLHGGRLTPHQEILVDAA